MVSELQSVRITFTKTGRLQFISHLDLMRTMRSALKRAKIPVKYTEGFNPHMKMTFALPLSIGTQSVCEFMDLTLQKPCDVQWVCAQLQAQLPPEMQILSAAAPVHTYQEIGWARYEIAFCAQDCHKEQITSRLTPPLLIKKRNKKGEEKEVDLFPSIASFAVEDKDGKTVLTATLRADNAGYLNPEHLAKLMGCEDYTILRTAVLLCDQTTPFC